jgi:glycosyltransferase involved in cell wall biosynthesis
MRVAIVSDAAYPFTKGGAEMRYHALALQLVAWGHRVDWYTMRHWEGQRVLVMDGIRYVGICRRLSFYSGGRRSILEPVVFGLACLRLLGLAERYDVVDCSQHPFFSVPAMGLVAKRWHSALVVSWYETWDAHWLTYLGWWGFVGRWVERWCAWVPQCLIVVSEQALARLRSARIQTKHAVHVPLGIELDRIQRAPTAVEHVDVIYFGRLVRHKNVDVLLRALALVVAARPSLRAVIVGDGPEASALRTLARELLIDHAVRFRGSVDSYDQLMGMVKAARLFILPSTKEGGGSIVTLEANACGTPVIAMEHPLGIDRSLIQEGVNGFWVSPPLTSERLAERIIQVLRDPRIDNEWRHGSVERSRAYDLRAMARRIEMVYSQVATGGLPAE